MTNDANMRERLNDIWDAWTLTPNDDGAIEKQHEVLPVVAEWLKSGTTDPEVVIRAVQLLLADPERPDLNKRGCWKKVRSELTKTWKSAGTGDKPFFYVQALLLAGWPQRAEGHFRAKPLMDSAWDIWRGTDPCRDVFMQWRGRLGNAERTGEALGIPTEIKVSRPSISKFDGITFSSAEHLKDLTENSQPNANTILRHLVPIATDHAKGLKTLSDQCNKLSKGVSDFESVQAEFNRLAATSINELLTSAAQAKHSQLDLLWWGQSRYSHTLRKPYRRLKSDKPALLWWATREAAELSQSVDVEPAAAYLVQTLEDLGQNVDEKKPVLEWMRDLHATLLQYGTDVPALSNRLDQIASVDALGLPITWVRRKAAQKEPFREEEAINDVALPLDKTIDLGDWASWIFRETLLDLHLVENKATS